MTDAARAGVTVLLVRYDHVSSRRPPGTIITVPSAAGLGPGQEELGWRVAQFESAVLVLGRTWEATRISLSLSLSLSLLVLGRTPKGSLPGGRWEHGAGFVGLSVTRKAFLGSSRGSGAGK